MNKDKRAQEEMVGFVIIVLFVIIIGVVFLGFSLRQKSTSIQHQDAQMLDIMQAMLAFSSCDSQVSDLIRDCYKRPDKECNNVKVCEYLEELFSDILEKTQGKEIADAFIQGYQLNISNSETLIYIEKGNLTGNYFSNVYPMAAGGSDLFFNLKFYYSR